MQIEVLDIIALVILVVSSLRAMFKGFVREFMAKAGLVVGFLAALMFSPLIAPLIDEKLSLGNWSNVASFALLFIAGYLVSRLAAQTVRSVLEGLNLAFVDHFLGFLLGTVEGAILISFIVYLLRLQNVLNLEIYLTDSVVVRILEPIAPYGIELIEESL